MTSKIKPSATLVRSQLLPAQLAAVIERELPRSRKSPVKLSSRREFANRFGVSLPTVTAALKELQRRELVFWVPGKGMYSGSGARERSPRLFTIGLLGWFSHVCGDNQPARHFTSDTYRLYLLGDLMAQASLRGWQVSVIPQDPNKPVDIEVLRHASLDALVLKDPPSTESEMRAMRELGIPLISDSMKYASLGVGYVAYDNIAMMREIVNIFVSRGHRRIAYVGIDTSSTLQNQMMRQTFFTALIDAGLIYDFKDYWRVCSWESWRATPTESFLDDLGGQLGEEVLSLPERPTAMFVWQPSLAAGVTRAVRNAGLTVPRDISVLTDAIDVTATPLSTFVQPHQELAGRLVERVKDLVDEPALRIEDKILKKFVDQGSIATIS